MFEKGTIYLHPNKVFSNHSSKPKFFIQLNDAKKGDKLWLVMTTTKPHGRPAAKGCHASINLPAFFLPPGSINIFPDPTWVVLSDFEPYTFDSIQNPLQVKGKLDKKLIQAIVDCFLEVQKDDLPPIIKNQIIPPSTQQAASLAELFNKRRNR